MKSAFEGFGSLQFLYAVKSLSSSFLFLWEFVTLGGGDVFIEKRTLK
jgi:hypothetical protein